MSESTDKVALVTGGSSGIGACTVTELMAAGFTVYSYLVKNWVFVVTNALLCFDFLASEIPVRLGR